MRINDRWSIVSGTECFVVEQSVNGKNSKGEDIVTVSRTYHPSLAKCAAKIIKSETLAALESKTLADAVKRLEATGLILEQAVVTNYSRGTA